MNCKVIESREIVWCNDDDRYILIIRSNNEIIGLNFMQGDEFELFVEHFSDIDHELTDFYNSVKLYLRGDSELDRVNQAMWAHLDYKNRKFERKTGYIRPQRGL